jgi:hypothetical protein
MAPSIHSFPIFAGLLLAARQRAADSASAARTLAGTPLAQRMAEDAEEIARHFTHPERARDDALVLFWQVAPEAFAEPALMVGDLDPDAVADRMVAAIRRSRLGRDFRETVLAEPLFRQITHRCVALMAEAEA